MCRVLTAVPLRFQRVPRASGCDAKGHDRALFSDGLGMKTGSKQSNQQIKLCVEYNTDYMSENVIGTTQGQLYGINSKIDKLSRVCRLIQYLSNRKIVIGTFLKIL